MEPSGYREPEDAYREKDDSPFAKPQKEFFLNVCDDGAPTLSVCVDSWNMRASIAAATKLLAAVMA